MLFLCKFGNANRMGKGAVKVEHKHSLFNDAVYLNSLTVHNCRLHWTLQIFNTTLKVCVHWAHRSWIWIKKHQTLVLKWGAEVDCRFTTSSSVGGKHHILIIKGYNYFIIVCLCQKCTYTVENENKDVKQENIVKYLFVCSKNDSAPWWVFCFCLQGGCFYTFCSHSSKEASVALWYLKKNNKVDSYTFLILNNLFYYFMLCHLSFFSSVVIQMK